MTIVNASRGTSKKYVDDQDALRTTAINNEVTRATGVEAGLRTDVDANTAAITAERNRATAAEGALNDLIGTTTSYGTVTQAVLDDAKDYTDDQITQRVTQVYSIQGSCTYTQLLAKTEHEVGNVWNVTTSNGKEIGDPDYVPPGTNWVWVEDNPQTHAGHWDAMGGTIDLSAYETTSAVDTKLAQYAKATKVNTVLAQHQNLIFQKEVTVQANDITSTSNQYSGRKTIEGLTKAFVESDPVVIVSPDPSPSPSDQSITSIQAAVNCGLYATGLGWDSQQGKAYITFKSDIAPTDSINIVLTFVDLSAGVQIPVNNGNVVYD